MCIKTIELAHKWAKNHDPDLIVQIGDMGDQKGWSRWPKDPDDPNPKDEYLALKSQAKYLAKLFPKMHLITGNHDRRWMKKAAEAGIPSELVRAPDEVFNHPGWIWHTNPRHHAWTNTKRGKVLFIHGDELAGTPIQKAINLGCNVVQGHTHKASITYKQTFDRFVFGFESGHAMDVTSKAADYAASNPLMSVAGFGVIQYGLPFFIPSDGSEEI
jgi:predicted phosphodiesterase